MQQLAMKNMCGALWEVNWVFVNTAWLDFAIKIPLLENTGHYSVMHHSGVSEVQCAIPEN